MVFCCNRSSSDSKSVCSLTSLHETVASLCREEKTRTKIESYCSVSSSFTKKILLKFVKCASVFVFHWPGVLLLIHNAQWLMLHFANSENKTGSEPVSVWSCVKSMLGKEKPIFPIVRSLVWGTMRSETILRLPLFFKVILLFVVQGKRLDCRFNEFKND